LPLLLPVPVVVNAICKKEFIRHVTTRMPLLVLLLLLLPYAGCAVAGDDAVDADAAVAAVFTPLPPLLVCYRFLAGASCSLVSNHRCRCRRCCYRSRRCAAGAAGAAAEEEAVTPMSPSLLPLLVLPLRVLLFTVSATVVNRCRHHYQSIAH
jgi:hypothetical protein